ncbi:MAG: adenylate/guanylate cyclase domain-containing protein [Rhodoferax sp.]|nr:adenylate/guanylate cyclase domain-containing protein [Rhodoferax sp.]
MRQHWWRRNSGRHLVAWALVGLFAGHAAAWWTLPLLPRVEALLYDLRVRAVAPRSLDERVVIVDIDEKSLQEKELGGEGRWPWRRDRLAQLVDKLFQDYRVSLVAFDIVLSEKDDSSGLDILEQLGRNELRNNAAFVAELPQLRRRLSFDDLLGQSLQSGPVVLGYAFHNGMPSKSATLPNGFDPKPWGLGDVRAQSFPGYAGLLPKLQGRAAGAGHLNPLRDDDGVTRRVPLLVEHSGLYYPALGLAVLQVLTGSGPLEAMAADDGQSGRRVEKLIVGGLAVPVDRALNALVPFRGAAHSFPYVSASDVLHGRVPKEQLSQRIVLVGTSAAGLADLVTTPTSVSFPGVEVHANLITGLLDQRLFQAPAYAQAVELLGTMMLGGLMVFAGGRLKPSYTLVVFLAALLATVSLGMGAVLTQQLMLPMSTPLACLLVLFLYGMGYGYFVEARGRRQMSALFANYVPPELVTKMAENPEAFTMAPMERELTVLFADVRNFTAISEHLSPEALAELINAYLTAMSEVVRDGYRGTLDKYIGDAVMAFWGAPVPNAQHAQDAVHAAIAMQRAAGKLNLEFQAKAWPELRIGIGLNSGSMRVGDMGSKIRRAYTVMGDAVNLGARLEGLTKVYGVDVLIGEATRDLLRGWLCREVDLVRVKGKDDAVRIFEPLGLALECSSELHQEKAQWDLALAAYRRQQWLVAHALFVKLRLSKPDCALYALFSDRAAEYQLTPRPSDWDGATQFDRK